MVFFLVCIISFKGYYMVKYWIELMNLKRDDIDIGSYRAAISCLWIYWIRLLHILDIGGIAVCRLVSVDGAGWTMLNWCIVLFITTCPDTKTQKRNHILEEEHLESIYHNEDDQRATGTDESRDP